METKIQEPGVSPELPDSDQESMHLRTRIAFNTQHAMEARKMNVCALARRAMVEDRIVERILAGKPVRTTMIHHVADALGLPSATVLIYYSVKDVDRLLAQTTLEGLARTIEKRPDPRRTRRRGFRTWFCVR